MNILLSLKNRIVPGFILAMVVCGCGKFGNPLPPEAFSPRAVQNLQVFPELNGVKLTWNSPRDDLRGQELKTLDGYQVERKDILKASDVINSDIEFSILKELEDKSVKLREEQRELAREQGMPARKIKSESELEYFEFLDTEIEPGKEYLYKITPLNQGGIKGQVAQQVRVLFRGVSSVVTIIDSSKVGELAAEGDVLPPQ